MLLQSWRGGGSSIVRISHPCRHRCPQRTSKCAISIIQIHPGVSVLGLFRARGRSSRARIPRSVARAPTHALTGPLRECYLSSTDIVVNQGLRCVSTRLHYPNLTRRPSSFHRSSARSRRKTHLPSAQLAIRPSTLCCGNSSMLFSQRKSPAFPSHPPSFNGVGIGAFGHATVSDSASGGGGDPPSSSSSLSQQQQQQRLELTTTFPTTATNSNSNSLPSATSTTSSSASAFVDSPALSSPDQNTPQLAITTTSTTTTPTSIHGPETIAQAWWSYRRGPSISPRVNLDENHFSRRLSQQQSIDTVFKQTQQAPPTSPSSNTFSFATVSSAPSSATAATTTEVAGDDVIPKIEEVDDNEPLSVGIAGEEERLMDVDPLSPSPSEGLPNSEVTSPVEPNPNEPPPLKRKRGRPRKHPLPTPGQSKAAAKGRSKTGCATCRRRKKKCDETKPACLNCQKNAVVCEGYPVREVWKSGKQKIEEEGKLFFFFFFKLCPCFVYVC